MKLKFNKIAAAIGAFMPLAAMADPITIITSLVVASKAALWIKAAVLIGAAVISSADARRRRRKAEAAARRSYNASLQDRSVTTLRTLPPVKTVYGRCITGGDLRAIITTDKTGTRTSGASYTKPDALKHLIVSFAEHECQALHEIYIDGVPIGLSSVDVNGWVTTGEFVTAAGESLVREIPIAAGASYVAPAPITSVLNVWDTSLSIFAAGEGSSLVAGSYTLTGGNTITNTGSNPVVATFTLGLTNRTVRVSYHLGSASQTVDTYLNGVAPTQWTADHRLRGIAYAVITLDLENQRFQGGPPNFTFDVSGKDLYDPRTSTTYYNNNPALVIRDYLIGEHGYGCDPTEVDDTYIIAAANVCDQLISLDIGGVVTTNQPRYTCDGVVSSEDDKESTLSELVGCMAGQAHYGAKWLVLAGAWTAPVMDLTDDDLQGQISILQADETLEEVFNSVRGTYIAADKSTPTDFDEYKNAAFISADGEELWDDMPLLFTSNKARARNLARIRVEQSRNGQIIQYPAKLKALPLQIGDRVRVTSAEYGFSLKPYRVTDWQSDLSSPVLLTLQEDTEGTYDLADAASADPTPNSGLASPWIVAAITGLSASSGLTEQSFGSSNVRVRVGWNAITDPYISSGGRVVVRWRQVMSAVNVWEQQEVPGNDTVAFIPNATPGSSLIIEVYAQNTSNGATGPRTVISHTVSSEPVFTNTGGIRLVNTANCTQFGDVIMKTSGAPGNSSWDAGMHSQEAHRNGAFASVTCHPLQGAYNVMFGLNASEAGPSYTDIDFAIFLEATGNIYSVYENGTQVFNSGANFVAGDTFTVVYDGQSVRYARNGTVFYQRGVVVNDPLRFDCAILTFGGRLAGVRFGPISNLVSGRNLIDSRTWVPGTSGSQPGFAAEGTSAGGSDQIVLFSPLPGGNNTGHVWQGTSGSAAGTSQEGGFRSSRLGVQQAIDHTRTYRFTCWVRREAGDASGFVYLGPGENSVYDIGGGVNANPYFLQIAWNTLFADEWYLMVGYVLPSSYSGIMDGLGGIFRARNGDKPFSSVDFQWAPGQREAHLRCYTYYTTAAGAVRYYYNPRLELVDGTEPSVRELLAMGSVSSANPINNVNMPDFIDGDAVTEVYVSTPSSNVTVTNVQAVPQSLGRYTLLASITFTPEQDGEATVQGVAQGAYTADAGGSGGSSGWIVHDDAALYDGWKRVEGPQVPAGDTQTFLIYNTRRIPVTAGVTYTFVFKAQKWASADTFVCSQIELSVEVIKA